MKQPNVIANPVDFMSRLRTRLLIQQPFFGTLLMRLEMVVEEDARVCDTAMTDGVKIMWHPPFFAGMTEAEAQGVLAHETLHCALTHMYRRQHRDPYKWNVAADFAINPLLLSSGFSLPGVPHKMGDMDPRPGYLLDPKFKDMSAEQIYALIPDQKQGGGGSGKGKPSPGDGQSGHGVANGAGKGPFEVTTGGFGDAPTGEAADKAEMTEQDWQIAAEQDARVALAAGKLPGGLERLINESRQPTVDWRTQLRRFLTHTIPYDYSWARPNRRFISRGLYLPGVMKENIGKIVVVIDTSGSITQPMLNQFGAELTAILNEAKPEKIIVIYCDAAVQGVDEFSPEDGEVLLKMKGGGDTAFNPAFDYVAKHELNPVALVYLTDLECYDTPKEPEGFPVMWGTPEWVRSDGPFGETVRIGNI